MGGGLNLVFSLRSNWGVRELSRGQSSLLNQEAMKCSNFHHARRIP